MRTPDTQRLRPGPDRRIEKLKQESFMYAHFIDGLMSGRFTPLSDSEMDRMIQTNFFDFEPLTPLGAEQEDLLKASLRQGLSWYLGAQHLAKWCGETYFDGETVYVTDDDGDPTALRQKSSGRLLTPREKIKLLFDLKSVKGLDVREIGRSTSGRTGLTGWGNRHLLESDAYFSSEDEFRTVIGGIRSATGREKLKVLDLGGGIGLAASDMKKLDSLLETHVVTREQEFAMAAADKFYYVSAERLPAHFEGQYDLIVSNISFRYYLFQHIALRNAVRSLAKGGRALLGVTCDSMPREERFKAYFKEVVPVAEEPYYAMKVLLRHEYEKMKKLESVGKIQMKYYRSVPDQDGQGYYDITKLDDISASELE